MIVTKVAFLLLTVQLISASIPRFQVSKTELTNLVNELRRDDRSKASPSQIRLNYQGHCSSNSFYDHATRKLFTSVDSSVFRRSTFAKFRALLNNYNRDVGKVEYTNQHERNEINAFLDAIMNTQVMLRLYNFLHLKRHSFAGNQRTFRNKLQALWFNSYSRAKGVQDTSGFEHVMVGEAKNGEVGGLHNWYQFYLLEKSGKLDYKGFLVKRNNIMVAARFTWMRETKHSATFLIGTSPEFDVALKTLCFLTHHQGARDPCEFEIDHCPMSIISHTMTQSGRTTIGSMYAKAGRYTNACRNAGRRNQN